MKGRTEFSLFPKFRRANQFIYEDIASWTWKIYPISTPYLFPNMTSLSASFSSLCRRSFSTFPIDGLYPLNWTNFLPRSIHQQQLLRDCYQNNTTAEKEALKTSYEKQIWRPNSTNFSTSTGHIFLTKLIRTRKPSK